MARTRGRKNEQKDQETNPVARDQFKFQTEWRKYDRQACKNCEIHGGERKFGEKFKYLLLIENKRQLCIRISS